jgi:hypothetical protein
MDPVHNRLDGPALLTVFFVLVIRRCCFDAVHIDGCASCNASAG